MTISEIVSRNLLQSTGAWAVVHNRATMNFIAIGHDRKVIKGISLGYPVNVGDVDFSHVVDVPMTFEISYQNDPHLGHPTGNMEALLKAIEETTHKTLGLPSKLTVASNDGGV
ncbi:hypothetical protein RVBP21_1470 [Pseudomonas phage BRkr]|nr:hypothetical protein RVBP21_1470 [Pseudomonas phage BRkr]